MRAMDPEPADEFHSRPRGVSCLVLLIAGISLVVVSTLVVVVAGSVFLVDSRNPGMRRPTAHPAEGKKLPQLKLEPLTGADEPVTLDALAGKVVLVNLWGPWCGPCVDEAPEIAELDRKFRDHPDFKLLSISYGATGPPEDMDRLRKATEAFLARSRLDTPTYADPDGTTVKAFLSIGGQTALPTNFVLDREGTVRGVWAGYNPRIPGKIERSLLQLLEDR